MNDSDSSLFLCRCTVSSVHCHHGHHRTDRFLVSKLSVPDGTVKSQINAKEAQRRQYEGHNTPLGCCTDQGPQGWSQYDDLGMYCGLSTASEVFLIFTTQLYQYFSGVFFYLHN